METYTASANKIFLIALKMKIVVGLGNTGMKYYKSRHNAGFLALDLLREDLDLDNFKNDDKLSAEIVKTHDILLAKPTTLMNRSGEAVQKILHFYKESPENLIVIYDDIDLPLGKIRVRSAGSAGTHNGMKSVIEHLGTQEFTRIRIGIENRSDRQRENQELSDYVLDNFSTEEVKILLPGLSEAVAEAKKHLT